MLIEAIAKELWENGLETLGFFQSLSALESSLEFSAKPELGDVTLPCFRLGGNPNLVANRIKESPCRKRCNMSYTIIQDGQKQVRYFVGSRPFSALLTRSELELIR